PAYEVLLGTQPVQNLVREGKSNQLRNAMQIALSAGHKTLEMSLNELVAAGIITHDTAVATAFVPHEIAGANILSPLMAQPLSRRPRAARRTEPGREKTPRGVLRSRGSLRNWVGLT